MLIQTGRAKEDWKGFVWRCSADLGLRTFWPMRSDRGRRGRTVKSSKCPSALMGATLEYAVAIWSRCSYTKYISIPYHIHVYTYTYRLSSLVSRLSPLTSHLSSIPYVSCQPRAQRHGCPVGPALLSTPRSIDSHALLWNGSL